MPTRFDEERSFNGEVVGTQTHCTAYKLKRVKENMFIEVSLLMKDQMIKTEVRCDYAELLEKKTSHDSLLKKVTVDNEGGAKGLAQILSYLRKEKMKGNLNKN